ncbi:MAG TPA: CHASE domain-containing protein [Chthoniobacteraceae bacterium]|jgi:sensor domain CHASE-containing protein|nr:CHASE domain-containing protein [Chthoniobacteraceae bacterium]
MGSGLATWLPISLMLAVIAGAVALFLALKSKQDQEIVQAVKSAGEAVKSQIEVRMESRDRSLLRMAKDWEFSGVPTQGAWDAKAANYVHDFHDMQALEWVDQGHTVRWVAPLEGNESELEQPALDRHCLAAMEAAMKQNRPVTTGVIKLSSGEAGFVVYAPITVNGQPQGAIAAVFKAEQCLQRYLPAAVAEGEAISVSEGGQIIYARDSEGAFFGRKWLDSEKINLRGTSWGLEVWPTQQLAAQLDSALPQTALCAGILGALLLGAVSFYALRSSRQAAETARANSALRLALEQVKTLEGLLPICCGCKRVRDDTGYWRQIDNYLRKHTKASLSHGYCPECAAKFYEECGIDLPEKVKAELEAGNFE